MSITLLIVVGALAGAALALIFGTRPIGWVSLIIVPVSAILYINRWQAEHPEHLRSTSGLDYLFIPPIALAGALVAYAAIFFFRDWLETRGL